MTRTRIKICGIRTVEAALAAADAGADAIGFVFAPASPRYIDPDQAWRIATTLPPMLATVGVFVDPSLDQFCDVEQVCPTTLSQLQGREPESLVRQCGPGVIRAIRFNPDSIRAELARWSAIEEVDAILVDGSAGGAGQAFDWNALAHVRDACTKPLIIAGGLNADNVAQAIHAVRPYAVDVSSGVESAPGVKDPRLIQRFCQAVRAADLSRAPHP